MNIKQASEVSGVSERMIRHYETKGLLPAPARQANGYRDYTPDDLKRLRVITLAHKCGFVPDSFAPLLARAEDRPVSERDMQHVNACYSEVIDQRASDLEELRAALNGLSQPETRDIRVERVGAGGEPAPDAEAERRAALDLARRRAMAMGGMMR